MKRVVTGVLDVLVILAMLTIGATAAPAVATAAEKGGPYEGTFRGYVYGDSGSRAPINLELNHRGSQVEGTVYLGEGLYVNGGWCGAVNIPAVAQDVEGQTSRWNPRQLAVNPSFSVGGFELTVDFESHITRDGETIAAEAKVDIPWFCGGDPLLKATLHRE
jgi:hypothetical protein